MSSSKDDGVLINLAGKQRMLTQKITKESLLKSVNLFDNTLQALVSGDSEFSLRPEKDQRLIDLTLSL